MGLLAVSLLAPCVSADGPKARDRVHEPIRYFGNMPLVVDPDLSHFTWHFTPHHIAEDSNLLVLHMDWFPIPWVEFAAGEPLPPAWLREMDSIAALKRELGLPVYLALTPISEDHLKGHARGDAVLRSDDSFSRGCEAIASRPDYLSVVRPGYHTFVEYMVQRFEPRFLALSIEVNTYARRCPAAWEDMKMLLNEVYEAQKARRPRLPVFQTFQVENLWEASDPRLPCYDFRTDCLDRNLAPLAGLETDLFAMSVYPEAARVNHGGHLPENYLSVFAERIGKPLAVSETGYTAVPFSGLVPGGICFPGLPSSSADQAAWMLRLLWEADRLDMPFVTWWANEDLGPVVELAGCRCETPSALCGFLTAIGDAAEGVRYFGTMGLRDVTGRPRPALRAWRLFQRPRAVHPR
jgi:hypothetical protein